MIRELRTVRENYQDLINGPQRSLTLDIVQWTFCGSSDSIELCTFDGLPIGQAVLQLSRNTGLICKKKKNNNNWEGPSELPHRRSSSSAPRRDSTEPRARGCSVLGEPPQALPGF